MRVRINESREDELASGIDNDRIRWPVEVPINAGDRFALTPNVGHIARFASDDFTVLNQETHGNFLR